MRKKPLRWSRAPRKTGLEAIGAPPRGWVLKSETTQYAAVYPAIQQGILIGWYWVAGWNSEVSHYNSFMNKDKDDKTAKENAMNYVKEQLAAYE